MGTTADVLIVGAGPVGLTAALLLSRQGVSVQVVDRRERLSVLPRATGVSVRSMEVLREVGLDDAVARVSLSGDGVPFLLVGESLIAPVRAAVEPDQVPVVGAGRLAQPDARRVVRAGSTRAAAARGGGLPVVGAGPLQHRVAGSSSTGCRTPRSRASSGRPVRPAGGC